MNAAYAGLSSVDDGLSSVDMRMHPVVSCKSIEFALLMHFMKMAMV